MINSYAGENTFRKLAEAHAQRLWRREIGVSCLAAFAEEQVEIGRRGPQY